MATNLSYTSMVPQLNSSRHRSFTHRSNRLLKFHPIRCNGDNSTPNSSTSTTTNQKGSSEPENLLLKAAWYASELLGIGASLLRPPSPSNVEVPSIGRDLAGGAVDRGVVVETIKEDFQRSYFVTGALTLDAYEEDCEFADPAGSFRGLRRFKRNCTNFGLLIEKSDMKLMKWENFELPATQSIILIQNLEKYAGMWRTGMFPKWLYSSNY